MQAYILREKFLDFFKSRKHKVVEPDSLVPKDDPTVLFTPAGMNQFKKEFMGFDSGFRRAATCQRCLRTDDLDKVGKTCGHHTFFEMLGNFSFGDYFKKDAITYAWEFLTEVCKLKKESLWVSVYKDDDEAYKIWKDLIKVPEAKIIKLGDKENFWPSEAKQKGPNGPCGPCSEIFFDQGKDVGCKKAECDPSCSCGRFLEIWNLVFTQFNRKEGGMLEPLPNKNIDTGMGLERLAAVMQKVSSNFETDLFQPIIKEIIAGAKTKVTKDNKEFVYAIADHLRAVAFAIYDGVLPSNEARGYVIRKLVRKSSLHLRALGLAHPFLYKLVPVLAEVMKPFYPQLQARKENIAEVILAEEKSFISTLKSSDSLFKEKFQGFSKKQNPEAVGKLAFQLYDTYGIPLELTVDWLEKQGINISRPAFDKELAEQKARSKLQSSMKGDVFGSQAMDYGVKESKFLGYEDFSTKAKILKVLINNKEAKKLNGGDAATIVLDKTCFYPESGGQVGDTGELVRGKNIFEVLETKKSGKIILHIGKVKAGNFKKNDLVSVNVNKERRLAIARNHTATHLLQAALRRVLGEHVQQQGSLVAEDKLRFDFTHFKAIDKEQLARIEELVNNYIMDNHELCVKQKSLAQAKKSGALAFFGEKYESKVRVVSIEDVSTELCGGTHLNYTGQIGLFKIIQEGSIASGIRRIEAVTGKSAYGVVKEQGEIVNDVSLVLGVPAQNIIRELGKRNSRIKELEKKLSSEKLDSLKSSLDSIVEGAEIIKDIKLITRIMENLDMDLLRKNIDLIKQKATNSVIALGSQVNGRAMLVMGVTEDLCQKGVDASNLIRGVAKVIGGSGGGRKDFAQAGGNKPENFPQAFEELKNIIRNLP